MKKILFLIVTAMLFSCTDEIKISGEGVVSENIENFTGIAVQDGFEVTIVVNEQQSQFQIETDKNIIRYVKHEVKNNILYLFKDRDANFPSNAQVKILVEAKSLNFLQASNAKIYLSDTLKTDELYTDISNSSYLFGNIKCQQLQMTINDSNVKLGGTAENMQMNVSGISFADLSAFTTENAKLNMAGGCIASVKTIIDELELYARDKSYFYYDVVGVFRSVILDDDSKTVHGTITLNIN